MSTTTLRPPAPARRSVRTLLAVESDAIRIEGDLAILDDHLALVAAAQAARAAGALLERHTSGLPRDLQGFALEVRAALAGDALCSERTLTDAGTLRGRLRAAGAEGGVEPSDAEEIVRALAAVEATVGLVLDSHRALRLASHVGAADRPGARAPRGRGRG